VSGPVFSPRFGNSIGGLFYRLVFPLFQPLLQVAARHITPTQTKSQRKRQTNCAEDQDECPNHNFRGNIQNLKDPGHDKNYGAYIGCPTERGRLLQSRVSTRSSNNGVKKICEIQSENEHHESRNDLWNI